MKDSIRKRKQDLLKRVRCLSKDVTNVEKRDQLNVLANFLKPNDIPLKDTGTFGEVTVTFLTEHGESKLFLSEILGR